MMRIAADRRRKIGTMLDLAVVAPDNSLSAAIIATGGFLGIATHDVAVPIGALNVRNGDFYLTGAARDALKATAGFEYTRIEAPKKPKGRRAVT
jgi:hypothetical protein